jgi:prefoldin subunit 4
MFVNISPSAHLPILILLFVQKEKEDLDDISSELELADEDEKIPCVDPEPPKLLNLRSSSYKIGDSFISLPLPEVQEMLSTNTTKIEEEVAALEEKLATVREEMSELKVELYARFGRSINLET